MSDDRVYGIREVTQFDPSTYKPKGPYYEIVVWEKNCITEIAGEPLTLAEAKAFVKLLRSANNDSE